MADYPKHPFLLSIEETAKALGTDVDKGLTTAQVTTAQEKYPLNELDVGGTIPWYKIMTKQVLNAMIIVSIVPSANRIGRGISQLTMRLDRSSLLLWLSVSVSRITSKVVSWYSSLSSTSPLVSGKSIALRSAWMLSELFPPHQPWFSEMVRPRSSPSKSIYRPVPRPHSHKY